MDSRFEFCFQFTLSFEGSGLENDPADPGGTTFAGIDQRDHPSVDVRHLTLPAAKQIYFVEKWSKFQCAQFRPPWDLLVFDSAVNPGPGFVVKALQGCVGATIDGHIGPKTIAASNIADAKAINCFIAKRTGYYNGLSKHLRDRFMAGWMNRTHELQKVALSEQATQDKQKAVG